MKILEIYNNLLGSNDSICDFFNLRTTGMDYYDGIIRGNGNQYNQLKWRHYR